MTPGQCPLWARSGLRTRWLDRLGAIPEPARLLRLDEAPLGMEKRCNRLPPPSAISGGGCVSGLTSPLPGAASSRGTTPV